MLLPRQQETPALYGSTLAPIATPSSHAASNSNSNSDSDSTDARNALWKYAIVVILAILALSTVFRLLFLRRARRMHRFHQTHQLGVARHRGPSGAAAAHDDPGDRDSLDLDDDERRRRDREPPPPAYDDDVEHAAFPPRAPPPLAPVEPRPSFLSRFSSRFKQAPSAVPPSATTSRQTASGTRDVGSAATAEVLAEENRLHRWRGDVAIRRALSDAGLVVVGRGRAGSRSSSAANERAAVELAQRERDERRRERRERRREQRRRRREREEEGLGLPVYSKTKAKGEQVLQVADGIEDDDTDSEADDVDHDDDDGRGAEARGVAGVGESEPTQPPASTLASSAATADPRDTVADDPPTLSESTGVARTETETGTRPHHPLA
ncbi:hypothetical protein JCM11491_000638 [Sporobolomyces phaffii]